VRCEIPSDVVREAIVNAIAHRDYASDAAVQVSVFADRFEVWNPDQLPPPLTPEKLRHPHSSIPRNHRVCETLFMARYLEKFVMHLGSARGGSLRKALYSWGFLGW